MSKPARAPAGETARSNQRPPQPSGQPVSRPGGAKRFWLVALSLLVLLLVAGIRLRLLQVPLERDEGEYAYAGQLLLQGVPPYQEVYSMKWPGTFAAYALIMQIFGQTIGGIHAGLLLVNLATATLVFLLGRHLCGSAAAGAVAAASYALLCLTPTSSGLAAHATHFVLLPALGGILLVENLSERVSPARIFCAGLLVGLAALMKQAGATFGLFAAAWLGWQELSQPSRSWRRLAARLGWLAAGGLLPLALTGILLAAAGVFDRFWLWTFRYSSAYVSMNTPGEGLSRLLYNGGRVFKAAPGLWGLAAAGLGLFFCDRSLRRRWFFVLGFVLFSFIALCPGGYFRGHYFLLLFPGLGLLAGIAVQVASRLLERWRIPGLTALPLVAFAFATGWFLFQSRAIFFSLTPNQVSRAVYTGNPFAESVEIGRYLDSHCPPAGRIAVVGSEPELYFYSHRRSATGYIYTYPLLEPQPYAQAMQQEMIREVVQAEPDYFVLVNVNASWLIPPDTSVPLVKWFLEYREQHLEPVGLVDLFPDQEAQYDWSGRASPRSGQWLQIYRNKKLALSVQDSPRADSIP